MGISDWIQTCALPIWSQDRVGREERHQRKPLRRVAAEEGRIIMKKKHKQPVAQQPRELVRRTTAMTNAMYDAFSNAGYDVSNARLPLKREPTWRVTRKG